MTAELHGYKYSVYAWITRFALHEKGVGYQWVEVNPFADDLSADYLALHPFGRVPTLVDGDFTLFETSAITRYIDEAFDGPVLQPSALRASARVNQIISIVDNYVYWPLVRQVFSHGLIGPRIGRPSDPSEYQQGLTAAPRILRALDGLVGDESFLVGDTLTLADIHLAPMMSYFTAAKDGFDLLEQHKSLHDWWTTISLRPAFANTKPQLPEPLV
jgi:glutathione S-transferase